MNTTTRFIEDAIKGEYSYTAPAVWHSGLGHKEPMCIYLILLDPLAWQAVGKTRWVEVCSNSDHGFIDAVGGEVGRLGCPCCGHDEDHIIASSRHSWKKKWHQFIDHLAEGKTIEEALLGIK